MFVVPITPFWHAHWLYTADKGRFVIAAVKGKRDKTLLTDSRPRVLHQMQHYIVMHQALLQVLCRRVIL